MADGTGATEPEQAVWEAAVEPSTTSSDLPSTSLADPSPPPMRKAVSSASELPSKGIRAAVFSQHVASDLYIEHQRKVAENLREAHRYDRAAWQIERQELYAKIAELEAKIERLQSANNDTSVPSMQTKLQNYSIGPRPVVRSASTPGDYASAGSSRHGSLGDIRGRLTTNGVEAKDATAVTLTSAAGGIDRNKLAMEAIPEENQMERTKSVSFAAGEFQDADMNKALEGFAIPGHLIDRDLDGIAIKATSLPLATKKAILEDSKNNTPSPLVSPSARPEGTDSPGFKRPVTIEIPSTQQIVQLPPQELNTYAAGNTPLARVTDDAFDDTDGTGEASPMKGASHTAEKEVPPLEPYPSTLDVKKPLRPPNERSDSYFNVPAPSAVVDTGDAKSQQSGETAPVLDEDPALVGPLSMPSHPPPPASQHGPQGGANEFLDKLDEKLTSLSRQQSQNSHQSPPVDNDAPLGRELPLRIRRSINFGSQLGQDPR